MTTKKSHKSRHQQTKTAQAKTASPSVPAAESAVGDASSSVSTALTRSPLPALLGVAQTKDAADTKGASGVGPIVVMPPPIEERPFWYRAPDSKTRVMFEKIVVHRAAGRSDDEIAKLLKTTGQMVRQAVYLAKKNGWANDDGDEVNLEAQLAIEVDRKVVRNIGHVLDGGMVNHQTQEMTIAAAKGRGIFKNHDKTEGGVTANVLAPVAIQIVMPTLGSEHQQIVEENVGGLPAFIEGEAIDGNEHGQDGGNPYKADSGTSGS